MNFFLENECRKTQLDNGVILSLLAHDEEHVTTFGSFLPRGIVKPAHSHPEIQIYIVISGMMRVTIGDEAVVMKTGDTAIVPGNVPHITEAFEDTVEIEVFIPARPELVMKYFPK
jgi:quercetin dioxygenase-like cupin family protein